MTRIPGTNSGHGWAWERPDGMKARCGGTSLCSQCKEDATVAKALSIKPMNDDSIRNPDQVFMYPQEGNETPRLGRKVHYEDAGTVFPINSLGNFLMMPLYGTVAEYVPGSKLRPYPSEPIPQP